MEIESEEDFYIWVRQFQSMGQPTRAWALLGAYMGYFALMEAYLGEAIERLLGVDPLRSAILQRNMGFSEKVKTFRTIGAIGADDTSKSIFEQLGKRLLPFAEERNSVAHSPYGESRTTDGVEFYTVKASSKLRFVTMDWTVEEACRRIDALRVMGEDLRATNSIEAYKTKAAALNGLRDEGDDLRTLGEFLAKLPN